MMLRRRLALAAAIILGVGSVAMGVLSAVAEEPASMFHSTEEDGSRSIIDEAGTQRLDVLRLLSGPQAFRAEPDASTAPSDTLYVVVAPTRGYTADEVDALTEFLMQGGQLLVADNFGQANSLTTPFGITFERVRLVNGPSDGPLQATLEGQDYPLRSESPTALHLHPEAAPTVIAWSPADSYLDRDGDGLVNAWEPSGPFPVAVESTVGDDGGRIIAVSDPSLLWIDEDDGPADEAFLQALLEHTLPDGGRVVIDESRTTSDDPVLAAAATVVGATTEDPWRIVIGVLAASLFAAGVLVTIHGVWGPHHFDLDRFIRRADIKDGSANPSDPPGDQAETDHSRVHWTRRGKTAAFGGVLLAVLGITLGNLQATYGGAFLLAAATLSMWTRGVRVDARRITDIHRVHEDSSTPMDLALRPKGLAAATVEIRDHLPTQFDLADGHNWFQATLHPKRTVPHRYTFRAGLRGPYQVGPLRVRSTDPFGLRTIETEASEPHRLLVLPRNDPLSRIPFKSRIPVMTMGPHLVNRAGDGTEFHSLRDYQSGDSIRIVNWKASARSKDLVVNQRVHESKATLTVFLDARAITQAGPLRTNPVNQGCRAAQSIVAGGLQARDNVRVFVYGDGVRELCSQVRRGKGYELSEALASVEPAGDMTFKEAVEETIPRLSSGSPAILISAMEGDATILDGLKLLGQRSIPSTVIAPELGTAPGTKGGEPEPGADRLQAERERMISHIRGAEIPVVPMVHGVPLGTLFQVAMQ